MQVLKEVYLSKSTNIILDCSKDIIGEVLTQAQQIGMISEDHFYLLTSLDTHTVDMSGFKVKTTKKFRFHPKIQFLTKTFHFSVWWYKFHSLQND